MNKRFSRYKENFSCCQCKRPVSGNGYTNHCPHCLWSRHVDIQPGDRSATCHGMMRPIRVEKWHGTYRIYHRCEECGHERPNKMQEDDDFHAVLSIARKVAQPLQ